VRELCTINSKEDNHLQPRRDMLTFKVWDWKENWIECNSLSMTSMRLGVDYAIGRGPATNWPELDHLESWKGDPWGLWQVGGIAHNDFQKLCQSKDKMLNLLINQPKQQQKQQQKEQHTSCRVM